MRRPDLFRSPLLILMFVGFTMATGCGPAKVPLSDSQQARMLAEKLLDQWKMGVKMDELAKQTPPVYVSEDLWKKEAKLTEFKFLDDGEMLGPNVRFKISLKCTGKDGKVTQRSFNYLVTTTPALTFFREEG
jgi:hypothetical protein